MAPSPVRVTQDEQRRTEGTSLWKPAAGAVQPGPGARSENRSPFRVGVCWWWGRGLVVTRQPPQRPRPPREIAVCSALWVWGLPTPNSKHLLIKTPLVRNTFTCEGRESVDWARAPVGVWWSPPRRRPGAYGCGSSGWRQAELRLQQSHFNLRAERWGMAFQPIAWECGPQGSRTEMLVLVEKETFFFFPLEIGSL